MRFPPVAFREHMQQMSTGTKLVACSVSYNLKQEVGATSNLAKLELHGTDYHYDNWSPEHLHTMNN